MSAPAAIRRLVNTAWIAACRREQARFNRALGRAAETQERYLRQLLRRNARTRFGQEHGFAQIRSVRQYQQRVPIASYEALRPHVEAISRGQDSVLTADPVKLLQPTSGSTSASKLIPWTATLASEFTRAIAPWMASLYDRKPALIKGTAYWSVSPPMSSVRAYGRLRVGFAHDAEYLGFFGQKLFSLVNAVPPEVAASCNLDEFRARTLQYLLADADLSLISVWSPAFLSALLEWLLRNRDQVLARVATGGGSRPKRRAQFLKSLMAAPRGTGFFEEVWPDLQVISCWTHGPSELYAQNLRRFFPHLEIQGKGLVATEAFVSLPFLEGSDPALALTSHFFEFLHLDGRTVSLAHELEKDREYTVVVTTGGGLYRYALGDRIRVTGLIQGAPCLRFVGRDGNVSDLFGEKLNGTAVAAAVTRALANQAVEPRFFLLAPVTEPQAAAAYALFLDSAPLPEPARLCRDLEAALSENFHYAHCRRLGQLAPVRLFLIRPQDLSPLEIVESQFISRGLKAGDIKPMPLDSHPGWERLFPGRFVP